MPSALETKKARLQEVIGFKKEVAKLLFVNYGINVHSWVDNNIVKRFDH